MALPPITARSWTWSLVLCLVALLLGIGVAIRGERRFGGFAIAAGALGFALAYLATLSSLGKLEDVVVWSALFAAMLRYATPLIFGALGGMFSERSGVVNIGLEGMMLMGAFFAILAADKLDSWWLGLIVGILSGGLMALLHAVLAIHLRADQIVGGTAINFLAVGLTGYLFIDIYGQEGHADRHPGHPAGEHRLPRRHPVLGDFLEEVFGHMNLMIWIAIIMIPLSWLILFKTPLGLRIRACGEHPRAADTVGISVYGIRYGAVVFSGMLAAAGGAFLSIGFVNSFNENMTAGRGFIALAAVIFGKLAPVGRCRGLPPVRLLERARPAPAGVLRLGRRALPGTPVRAHADRGRRRDRPLDPAGCERSPLQEIVTRNPRAAWSVIVGLLAAATMPVAIVATRYSRLRTSSCTRPSRSRLPLVLGVFAVVLARRARALDRATLGKAGGVRSGADRAAARHPRPLHGGLGDDRGRGLRAARRDRVAAPRRGLRRNVVYTARPVFEIGSSLREARTRQGLDINEMEFRTKIRAKYLRALEAEQFDQLPGAHVHQGLPAHVRRLARDGRAAVRRRVQLALRRGRGGAARLHAPCALDGTPPPRERAARVAARRDRGRRDRDPHGARHRGVEVRRSRRSRRCRASTCPRRPLPSSPRACPSRRRRAPRSWRCVPGPLAGKPLYRGTLERGQTKRFPSKKLSLIGRLPAQRRRAGRGRARQGARQRAPHDRAQLLTRPRAAVVVTGSELVRGERTDLNGPFYAQEALRLGLQPARIAIVGDDPAELEAALREAFEADVCLVSGGLGPTHDDRTIELVARVAGRGARVDEALEAEIEQISRRFAERMRRPYADFAPGVRKQATLPEGASRSASRARLRASCSTRAPASSSSCPGRPASCSGSGRARSRRSRCGGCWRAPTEPERRVLRLFGVSESAVAKALADAGGDGDGVEATICARDFEIHVDFVVEPGAGERADALERRLPGAARAVSLRARRAHRCRSSCSSCAARAGLTLGTAESCTGGLVAARLTSVPGSSDVFRGGIVAYEDDVKARAARRAGRSSSRRTGPSPPRWLPRWQRAPASGSASMSPSR